MIKPWFLILLFMGLNFFSYGQYELLLTEDKQGFFNETSYTDVGLPFVTGAYVVNVEGDTLVNGYAFYPRSKSGIPTEVFQLFKNFN